MKIDRLEAGRPFIASRAIAPSRTAETMITPQVGVQGFGRFEDLKAVHPRHPNVQEHQIGRAGRDLLQRDAPPRCRLDFKTPHGQEFRQKLATLDFVIDNQDLRHFESPVEGLNGSTHRKGQVGSTASGE